MWHLGYDLSFASKEIYAKKLRGPLSFSTCVKKLTKNIWKVNNQDIENITATGGSLSGLFMTLTLEIMHIILQQFLPAV